MSKNKILWIRCQAYLELWKPEEDILSSHVESLAEILSIIIQKSNEKEPLEILYLLYNKDAESFSKPLDLDYIFAYPLNKVVIVCHKDGIPSEDGTCPRFPLWEIITSDTAREKFDQHWMN